jgi:hypothetical protein
MVDGFTNHVMKVSKFGRPKAKDMVVAHITLRSWSLSSTGPRPENDRVEGEVIEFPPHLKGTLERALRKKEAKSKDTNQDDGKERDAIAKHDQNSPAGGKATAPGKGSGKGSSQDTPSRLPSIELRVSSIGISTNQFGDFSKCSVISDLIPQEDLKALGGTMQSIWDSFIHQPQTGRFLLFSVILGLLCEGIAREHRRLRTGFFGKMDLDNLFVSLPLPWKSPTDLNTVRLPRRPGNPAKPQGGC